MSVLNYATLESNYPEKDAAGNFVRIGGSCAPHENQCAIRLSHALVASGFSLAGYQRFGPACVAAGTKHVRGAKPLADFLWKKLGRPEIDVGPASAATAGVLGRTGIIFFRNCYQRTDGTMGHHIDLWNGSATMGYQGWGNSSEVWFWPIARGAVKATSSAG
ncbi:MAG: type VI secretion system amidase effector protein Tae4 [Phycisphaerales bacterium JB037]